jgi:hypothetical protein
MFQFLPKLFWEPPNKIGNSFSLRDDSKDGGGRTKSGTGVENEGIVNSCV